MSAREILTLAPPETGTLVAHERLRLADLLYSDAGVTFAGFATGLGMALLFEGVSTLPAAAATVLGLPILWTSLRRAQWRWRMDVAPVHRTIGELQPGRSVRVRGVVADGPTFARPGSEEPAVLAVYRGSIDYFGALLGSAARRRIETRAVDFTVVLPSSERVRIAVTPATSYLDPLQPRARPSFRTVYGVDDQPLVCWINAEARVAPGDTVEVLGTLDHVADADGERVSTRALPRIPILRGTRQRPILIRRVAAAASAVARR